MDFPQMAPLRAKPLMCYQLGKDLTLRVSMIDTLGHLSLVIPKVSWRGCFWDLSVRFGSEHLFKKT